MARMHPLEDSLTSVEICEICGRIHSANSSPPTESTEFTEPAAEESLPQIAQIYTDSLGAEDSSGGILASAAAK